MIAGAVKRQRDAPNFADRSPDVIEKAHLVFRGDECATFLSREDYVIKQIGVGVRHVLKLTRLSRNVFCLRLSLAPRTHSCWGPDPGAYAPGFMPSPASPALRKSATRARKPNRSSHCATSDRFTDRCSPEFMSLIATSPRARSSSPMIATNGIPRDEAYLNCLAILSASG